MTQPDHSAPQPEYITDKVVDPAIQSAMTGDITVRPDHVVQMTQVLRTGILRQITDHGSRLPTGGDELKDVLSVLRDLDHTAQTTSKLDIDRSSADNAARIGSLADSIISKMTFTGPAGATRVQAPDEGLDLPKVNLNSGESDIGEVPMAPDVWIQDRE